MYEAGKHFKDGHYRIVPNSYSDMSIENKSGSFCLGKERKGEAKQRWSLRLMEDDEYCILSSEQKIVTGSHYGQCSLYSYDK